MNNQLKILLVDDDIAYCDVLGLLMSREGYFVHKVYDPLEASQLLEKESFDLIVSDLKMPNMDGVELLKIAKKNDPTINFILLTAYGTIANAVEAMRKGAFTYIIKGSEPEELLKEVRKIAKLATSKKQNPVIGGNDDFFGRYLMTSKSEAIVKMLDIARKVATTDSNLLLLGESGVGKEILANYIHSCGNRRDKPFVAANCHAFSDNLLESELFGYEKGAFTGAITSHIGLFEAANHGTLFLDEIGDISQKTQAELLRAIETKCIKRIGSNSERNVDFRLISATNKDINEEIAEGRFREDLNFRIGTIIIRIPPLRERKQDIRDLINFFVEEMKRTLGYEQITFEDEIYDFLLTYDYPGNIRELRNIIERLAVLSDEGRIANEYIDYISVNTSHAGAEEDFAELDYSLKDLRHATEAKYIEKLLKKNDYSMKKTADALSISTRQLFNKITEYGICVDKESQ